MPEIGVEKQGVVASLEICTADPRTKGTGNTRNAKDISNC